MRRAVAKIQVQMGTGVSIADSIGNFSAENVTYKLHNGGRAGYIQPVGAIQGYPDLSLVSSRERYLLLQNSNITEKETNIYLYEYPTSNTTCLGATVNDSEFSSARQHITLHKANAPGDTTYYRLDFYNPITEKFLDTERNHHYLFTINKVRSEGYRTLSQAQNNPGSNIEYIIEINDGATRSASNGQYAIVTTGGLDTVIFDGSRNGNLYPIVSARYQLPTQMTSLASGTQNTIEVQTVTPGADADAFYDLAPVTLTNTNQPISVKVKANTTNNTKGVLIFRLGNITHRVYFIFHIIP